MMKNMYKVLFLIIIALCFVFVDLSLVCAQEDDTEEFTLEEITVTAQKREENQQKVPIAMDVISGEDLAVLGRDNVDEILKNISNVFINTSSDGQRISLRGITDDSLGMNNQHLAESVVAVNLDGSYNNMNNAGQNLYDIERVEVLFGPQSTMYGSNAPGGIVNVITAAPKTDRYSAQVTVEYGSYNLLNMQAVFNAPIFRDRIALRLAANQSSQDPYVEGDSESKTTSARLKTLYQTSDKLSFTLTGNWQKRDSGGMTGGSVEPFVNQDDVDDPWTPVETTGPGGGGNQFDQVTKGMSANIDWETFFGTISAVPSYSKSSSEGNGTRAAGGPGGGPPPGGGGPPPGSLTGLTAQQAVYPQQDEEELIEFHQEDSNVQKGAELRMTNAADFEWFQWIFGGTFYKSKQSRETITYSESTSYSSSSTHQEKKALYANISYPLWFYKKFALTVGYRQSWDKNYMEEIGGGREETRGNLGYSKPDWKYGFEYNLADHLMFYGNFSSSFRSASAGGGGGPGMESKPEELDSYTAGMKSRWFGNKLQVNISGFFYDYANKLCSGYKVWEDITELDLGADYMGQVEQNGRFNAVVEPDGEYPTLDHLDADGDGDTEEVYIFTANEPTAQGFGAFQSLGLDLQTSWIITSRDRLNFSISYLNSEWIDLHFDYTWNMIWPDEDYYGITPVNSPTWSMTASYERSTPLGSVGTLTPRIEMQHKTSYDMLWDIMSEEEAKFGHQEPYYLWDASASFNHASGRWSLNAYVKNIANYAVKRSYHGMTDNREMRLGDPRTYAASFSIKF